MYNRINRLSFVCWDRLQLQIKQRIRADPLLKDLAGKDSCNLCDFSIIVINKSKIRY